MKTSEYWRKRAEELALKQFNMADEVIKKEIAEQYRQAAQAIDSDISKWLMRFADANDISMAEARKWISAAELEELKWDVEKYIEVGRKNAANFDANWAKQLENASTRVHISKLEEVKLRMRAHVEHLYGEQAASMFDLGAKVITSAYRSPHKDLGTLGALDEKRIAQMLKKPWAVDGKTFSHRIWDNKQALLAELDKSLSQAVIRGDDPLNVTKALAAKLKTSETQAGRLVMTETAALSETSRIQAFRDLDVEFVEIVETLDIRVCEQCSEMDGRVVNSKDVFPGSTTPPFHPWCRGTLAPWFDDEENEKRAMRGADGKTRTIKVPKSINTGKSVGAMSIHRGTKITMLDGMDYVIPPNTEITQIKPLFGYGTDKELNDRFYLESDYGVPAEKWTKFRGQMDFTLNGITGEYEVHWYQADGDVRMRRVRAIVKRK